MEKALTIEQSMHKRVQISLEGRFMLDREQEFPCKVEEISLSDATFSSSTPVDIGSHIVAYVDDLGRLEGDVVEKLGQGFRIVIDATMHKREKLAAKLTWILNRHELKLSDLRKEKRIPPDNPDMEMKLDDGETYKCRLIDLTVEGAAFTVEDDFRPAIGTHVHLGRLSSYIVRHFEGGVAVKFAKRQKNLNLKEFQQ